MCEIVLSLCLSGRNDNYGFDFKRRFATAMNFLAWSAGKAGVLDRIEVVFTDWNSRPPLAGNLSLSEDAARLVRFIEVPPETAERHNPSFSPFHQSKAFNVAIRRARGKFIGVMPADILITAHAMRSLAGILDGTYAVPFDVEKTLLGVPRKMLPWYANEGAFFTRPEHIEHYLLAGDFYLKPDNVARGLMGGYGVFILPRQLIHGLRGVDERIDGWGYNDIDLALRAADRARLVNLSGYGVSCYDFEANAPMLRQKSDRQSKVHPIRPGTAENDEGWGLAGMPFKETHASPAATTDQDRATPVVAPGMTGRDWLACNMTRFPFWQALPISAAAMAAGWAGLKTVLNRALVYGVSDTSVAAALSLATPLTELTVAEDAANNLDLFWRWDVLLAGLHHVGSVHYVPTRSLSETETFDLIVINGTLPNPESLKRHCHPQTTVILSGASPAMAAGVAAELAGFALNRYAVHNVCVFSPLVIREKEAAEQWRPAGGNWIARGLLKISPRFSRIGKMCNLLMHQPLASWPHWIAAARRLHG
ncbi:MAG: hypothetical protein WC708_10330 [Lentisphaeria bacterium]